MFLFSMYLTMLGFSPAQIKESPEGDGIFIFMLPYEIEGIGSKIQIKIPKEQFQPKKESFEKDWRCVIEWIVKNPLEAYIYNPE